MSLTPAGRGPHLRLTNRRSRLLRVSTELDRWRERSVNLVQPPLGWIRYVRDALNMSGYQLAVRLNVQQPTLARLEMKEREGTITLRALQRVAHGLDCDVIYALVPRAPLIDRVELQARRAVAVALRESHGAPASAEEYIRELQVHVPRWIWGTYKYTELYDASDGSRSPSARETEVPAERR